MALRKIAYTKWNLSLLARKKLQNNFSRLLSSYYPIDENLFGLSEEQKQVLSLRTVVGLRAREANLNISLVNFTYLGKSKHYTKMHDILSENLGFFILLLLVVVVAAVVEEFCLLPVVYWLMILHP